MLKVELFIILLLLSRSHILYTYILFFGVGATFQNSNSHPNKHGFFFWVQLCAKEQECYTLSFHDSGSITTFGTTKSWPTHLSKITISQFWGLRECSSPPTSFYIMIVPKEHCFPLPEAASQVLMAEPSHHTNTTASLFDINRFSLTYDGENASFLPIISQRDAKCLYSAATTPPCVTTFSQLWREREKFP